MYRQGDVLIERIDTGIPEGAMPVPRDAGRVVLAYGERTGHAHAIDDYGATLLAVAGERYLRVTTPVMLRHEEHNAIPLEAGEYHVIAQREYHPEAIRPVLD